MSIWTHVNASFRLDSFGGYKEETIREVFGKSCLWESPLCIWDDQKERPEQYLPMGSEGSLDLSIWRNPEKSCFFTNVVTVFGDLRDFCDPESIEKWFKKVCNNNDIIIRQAVCEVDVEAMCHEVYLYHSNEEIVKFEYRHE